MQLFTLGFTQKSAEHFFNLLKQHQVKQVLDVRLNNVSQLAGFAKRNDLRFFLQELCQVDYTHALQLAPTSDLLKRYQKQLMSWEEYAQAFTDLMYQRKIEQLFTPQDLARSCLLCSEHQPHHCHRSVVVNYLSQQWGSQFKVVHLL